jgi:transposase-like protein
METVAEHPQSFDALFGALKRLVLDAHQVARLRDWLATLAAPAACLALIEAAAGRRPCPRCGHGVVHRCGAANGLQRYRCQGCRRTFNALTGTPLARLRHRGKWLPYLACLLDSRTVRASADEVGVHATTSFRWRHRFIAGVRRAPEPRLDGIVEVDETYLLESQKGSRHLTRPARRRGGKAGRPGIHDEHDCVLVARDRGRTTHEAAAGRGPVSVGKLATYVLPVLGPDIVLVSDGGGRGPYGRFAADAGLKHEPVNVRAGVRVRGPYHLQNVNGWHSRFKTWLVRFHGVASKYLANYTGWRRVLDAGTIAAPAHWLTVAVAAPRGDRARR